MPGKARNDGPAKGSRSSGPSTVSRIREWFNEDRRRLVRRSLLWVAVVSAAALGGVYGLRRLERRILTTTQSAQPLPVRIVLSSRPIWMPTALAKEIVNEILPEQADYHDPDLTRRVYERAKKHPWVRHVELACKCGRGDQNVGRVEIRAEFRKAAARVLGCDGYYRFVDADGFVLPPLQVPRYVVNVPARADEPGHQICYISGADVPPDRRAKPIHYVTIKGITEPSPGVGKEWPGQDLAEGLRLAKLISTRRYANQVPVIDVHKAPFLRMYAQVGQGRRTEIIFGRFPVPGGDYVVPTERKLAYLDNYVTENEGKLAGLHSRIDLCLDQLYVSTH